MKKLILYLKAENDQLRERGPAVGAEGQAGGQAALNQTQGRQDVDNIINNLMDKVNVLTEEKERLQNAVRTLKENSTLADKSPMDKQLWILKRTNAQMIEEKKALEDRINNLQREILEKNLKIEELSKRLGITPSFKSSGPPIGTQMTMGPTMGQTGSSPTPLRKELTWTEKLKQVFN